MAYSVGYISGAHFNPAVTIGLWAGGRFPVRDIATYVVAQVAGAITAAWIICVNASDQPGFTRAPNGLAVNGVGQLSPGGYSISAGLLIEILLTLGFLIVILGADSRAPEGLAPLTIGMALTLIHLISIPVTNTSVNPARSTGRALLVGGLPLQQLWLFWLAPALSR